MPRNVMARELLRYLVISGLRSTPCHCMSPTYDRVLTQADATYLSFCRIHHWNHLFWKSLSLAQAPAMITR